MACVLALASCSEDKFTREDAIQDRIKGGASKEIATCFVDEVIPKLGVQVLDPDFQPTEAQKDELTKIFGECMPLTEDTTLG